METPKKTYNRQGGRPVLSKSQRQEYRLTVRYNTDKYSENQFFLYGSSCRISFI